MKELLTPELSYEDKFGKKVFEEVPWRSYALPKCNQDVELIRLEGSEG